MLLISDADLTTYGTVGLIAAAAVVLIVVVLLLTILWAARRILRAARRSLKAVESVRHSTLPLWDLTTTNQVARDLHGSASSIRRRVDLIAGALEATEHREVRR